MSGEPLTPRELYFDNAATTPMAPELLREMMPHLTAQFGNASTIYPQGVAACLAVEKARRRVARTIGAQDDEIIFTASGSESDNLAIRGGYLAHALTPRPPLPQGERGGIGGHIVSCTTEHSAVLNTLRALEEEHGCEVTLVDVGESGVLDPQAVADAIRDDTALVSVMLANSETGVIHPIDEIAARCRERGVPLHCDAVQAIGRVPVDVRALGVDLLSLAAHKFHGPKGVGALFVREGVEIRRIIHGGSQERGLRAGTENVAGIVGMGLAIELAEAAREAEMPRLCALRDRIIEGLQSAVEGVHINGDRERCLPTAVNLSIEGIEGARLVALAGEEGLSIAAGSACTTTGMARSHVLTAMGLPDARIEGGVRITLGRYNTEAGVERLLDALPRLIDRIRAE